MVRVLPNTKLQLAFARLDAGDHHDLIWAKTGVSLGTISKICNIHHPNLPKAKGGHPRKLDATARRRAVHLVTAGSAQTTKAATQELENTLGTSISTRTVQRALVEEGLEAVTKKPKPKHTKDHVKACLEFAERHQHWNMEDWMRVGWSDETKINCYGSDGRVWVWKRPGEKLKNQLLKKTVAHGGGSITIWGCMFWEGPGYTTKLNNRLTKELYVEVLEDELIVSLEHYGKEVDDFILMHDNASSHKAGLVKHWLADKGIEVLE
ncbi:hypothetical protein OPQ81_011194 [Rhizoctonia solani]|nr:hypothetical protein OPQ81_011194 [Rhizoctonia solani]